MQQHVFLSVLLDLLQDNSKIFLAFSNAVMSRVFKSSSPTAFPGIGDLEKKNQNWFVVNTLKYFGYKVKENIN